MFRKGPAGFLLQDPSEEARRIRDTPALQDKSPPQAESQVRERALAVVRQRGGDASDRTEVLGEYVLQFGKYKGKTFRWLLENDVGYSLYLIKSVQREESEGISVSQGHGKDSLQSFLSFALSFREIQSLRGYVASGVGAAPAPSDDDETVGFGKRAGDTWKEVWDSRADGYAGFILGKTCVPGTRMFRLQRYLQQRQTSLAAASPAPRAQAQPLGIFALFY